MATGIKILHKSRDGRKRNAGGGVAIAFDTDSSNFKRRQLGPDAKGPEMMCLVGKIRKITRKIAVIVAYLPPRMRVGKHQKFCEVLTTGIDSIKSQFKDPLIVVAGDFNHRELSGNAGLAAVPTSATRGDNTLDVVFTNYGGDVKEAKVLEPLQANDGSRSDLRCVYVETAF